MQQAALTDIFNRKHWKGQSSWYRSLGFKSTKSIADLRNAEQMIPKHSAPKSPEGSPEPNLPFLHWKALGCSTLCKGELLGLHALLYQQGRAATAPGCGWRAVKTAEIPATTQVPRLSSWRQGEFAHGHLHHHPNTPSQRPGQTARG